MSINGISNGRGIIGDDNKGYIYALATENIIYIGQTRKNPFERCEQHKKSTINLY